MRNSNNTVFLGVLAIVFFCFLNTVLAESSVGKELEIESDVKLRIDAFHRTKEDTVMLKMTVINDSHSNFGLKTFGNWSASNIKLVHLGSRKLFHCIKTNSVCFGTKWESNEVVPPGMKTLVWGHFTSPPKNIDTVSLAISDLPPFSGLTIGSVPE